MLDNFLDIFQKKQLFGGRLHQRYMFLEGVFVFINLPDSLDTHFNESLQVINESYINGKGYRPFFQYHVEFRFSLEINRDSLQTTDSERIAIGKRKRQGRFYPGSFNPKLFLFANREYLDKSLYLL